MTAITGEAVSAMHAALVNATGNRSFPVRTLGKWQVAALQKLTRFSLLKPNWDSYGSPPIADSVIDAAAELLSGLPLEQRSAFSMTPVSGGGVHLEWEKGERKLILEVRPDATFDILIVDGDEITEFFAPSLTSAAIEGPLVWLDAR